MDSILKFIKRTVTKFILRRKGVNEVDIDDDILYETDNGRYICTSCGYDMTYYYKFAHSPYCPKCNQHFKRISYNPFYMGRITRSITDKEGDMNVTIHYN